MKKQTLLIISIIIVVVLVLAYLGRHKIKTMLQGSSYQSATVQSSITPTPTSSAPKSAQNDVVMTKNNSVKGVYLTDSKRMTLYIFDKDTKGLSNCYGGCAILWPPYLATLASPSLPSNISIIKRSDGSMQYAWKEMPLYHYAKDSKPGDINGDGIGGVWHIIKP